MQEQAQKNKYSAKKEKFFKEMGGRDLVEYSKDQIVKMDFPPPSMRYFFGLESFSGSIEETYFWLLNHLMYDQGMPEVEKITDLFSASEHSTFYNVAGQRIGINQDKVMQYLASAGKLIKELFQVVRELRILDERIEMYYKSRKMKGMEYNEKEWEAERTNETEKNNEIAVKGLYVDMAEGGAKNPASVFGLAQQLQYATLPDLFFGVHPSNDKEISELVDPMQYNENVKWVLKRKLVTYLRWKESTYRELVQRKRFTVKYLRQHYNTIRTYIAWIKPYLRSVNRMQMDRAKNNSAELISTFEGSMMELEFIAKGLPEGNKEVYNCISCHFLYRTMPQMNYVSEGYTRAPLHVGEITVQMRSYEWRQKEIDRYKEMREMEDLELAAGIEEGLIEAMDSLSDDIAKYVKEAEGVEQEEQEEAQQPQGQEQPQLTNPFTALFDAFATPFKGLKQPQQQQSSQDSEPKDPIPGKEAEKALKENQGKIWLTYKNYKKSHGMITW